MLILPSAKIMIAFCLLFRKQSAPCGSCVAWKICISMLHFNTPCSLSLSLYQSPFVTIRERFCQQTVHGQMCAFLQTAQAQVLPLSSTHLLYCTCMGQSFELLPDKSAGAQNEHEYYMQGSRFNSSHMVICLSASRQHAAASNKTWQRPRGLCPAATHHQHNGCRSVGLIVFLNNHFCTIAHVLQKGLWCNTDLLNIYFCITAKFLCWSSIDSH